MSWNDRTSIVLDAPEEAFARHFKRAGPIDYAYCAVRRTASSEVGAGKVRMPATEMYVAFLRSEHRTQMIFGLRDCEHLAQPHDSAKRAEERRTI